MDTTGSDSNDEGQQRFCKKCDRMLPLDLFRKGSNRYLCHAHLKEEHKVQVLGTLDKRAFNSLRCRCRKDTSLFNQNRLKLSRKEVVALLTRDQLARYSQWCIVPRNPQKPLTPDNAAVISSYQRRYLICNWKFKRDPELYQRDLSQLLEDATGAPLPPVA